MLKRLCFILFFLFFIKSSAFCSMFEVISSSSSLVYSPELKQWSLQPLTDNNFIFNKSAQINNYTQSIYSLDSKDIYLSSTVEFVYDGKLFGVNNNDLQIYEIVFEDNLFLEKLLTYDEVQKQFETFDVIKLSDFRKEIYNIINNGHEKNIILYNDKQEMYSGYFISPEKVKKYSEINSFLKLPKRGKITFSSKIDKKKYIIKVR